ncbi:cortical protein marker for cell polarity-domain-containing protein [Cristinia sonorae]|uniref:Cortical protein marker for cell polarity-domain-containing protein n=1 Tax=Cristinia sonorae TaxID=1940300 RepID=A0A8K0XKW7_9AGAR|nr:cortical protein marker for cell polarity-domain-containing protein [Cristinia sonorae]
MVTAPSSRHLPRLLSLVSLLLLSPFVIADLPLIDYDRMGKVGLAGSFAGLDFFTNSSSITVDPSTSTLLSRSPEGALTRLASSNSGGSIVAGCTLGDAYYFAGSFSSIGNLTASNIASYALSSGSFAALGSSGPNGQIDVLYCDSVQQKVWAGGSFTSPAQAIAVWDVKSSTWSAPPFGGLQGTVNSITTNSSQASLFFAGSFTTSFSNGSVSLNGTSNPRLPPSTGATPFSSSLVPVPLQNAEVDASPSSDDSQFSNISNIFCPAGDDGPGNTWLARDGSKAFITVRKFSFLSASGIRIGNTFQDGHGTTGFTLTTIPDNTVQTLQYVDPATGANRTCSDPCPLLTDPSVPYQDFIFSGPKDITGFQLTLSQWTGSGSGLHLLQLLSSGAFASSVNSENGESCFAPSASETRRTQDWTEKQVNTNIPGTTQTILVATVDVNTPPLTSPTFTWMPYVSASGDYTVNMLIPGCINNNCAVRTSVLVTVFPGGGLPPTLRTISQQNEQDAVVPLYTGPVVPTSDNFSMTITMALADPPAGNGQDGKYELVADRVQLILNSPDLNATAVDSGASNISSGTGRRSFGFLEWPLTATGKLTNSSVTALDDLGFDLFDGLGGGSASISGSSALSAVAHHSSGLIFIGGNFKLSAGPASGASNIVAYRNGALTQLPNQGLNGPVSDLLVDGDKLYVAGSFTDTPSGSTQGKLKGVAMYDVARNQWVALDGGVNGAVASLGLSNSQLLIAGNFSSLADGGHAAGLASWNETSGSWGSNSGFLIGSLSFVSNGTVSKDVAQILSGHIAASYGFGASGFVMLQNGGSNGIPKVTPLSLRIGSSASTPAASVTRRSHAIRSATGWFPRIGQMFKRQGPDSTALVPLPSTTPAPAPAVLAGAFWTNSSSKREVTVIGGNFTFTTASGATAQNLALYDSETNVVSALQGNPLNGAVQTLFVQGDELFIGGTLTVQGTTFNGFALYNFAQQAWDTTGVQALQGGSGAPVIVRSITTSPSQSNIIIVAGSFAQAGDQPCQSICSFNTQTKQWSALGNGIKGDVASVAYGGNTRDVIVVSGSIALADGTLVTVAQYAVANSTWSNVGDSDTLPGPVTALEVNDGNLNSIFAAGRSADGSYSYLTYWNGQVWQSAGQGFSGSSSISQMVMVPLQNTHAANSIVEADRMLLLSGSVSDPSFGNASSVLFDGQNFIPYIVSSSSSGSPGVVSSLIHSLSQFSFTQRHFLATGVVILISIAIAAGVVFLLALIGILWTLFSRRDEKLAKFDPAEIEDDNSSTHRPSSLLEHINAATRSTIMAGQSPFAHMSSEKDGEPKATSSDPFAPDASNFARAETPSDAIVGGLANEEMSRPAHARYSFDGTGEGELPLAQGQEIEVLDDGDTAWWYARDIRTGREGVVPASYVY